MTLTTKTPEALAADNHVLELKTLERKVMRGDLVSGTKARPARGGRAAPCRRVEPQPVRLEYDDAQAHSVAIIGTFNNWDPSSTRMARLNDGRWVRVLFLAPGRYEYLLLVDGRCVADPRARETVPNVYGCSNSVLTVSAPASRSVPLRRPAREVTPRAPEWRVAPTHNSTSLTRLPARRRPPVVAHFRSGNHCSPAAAVRRVGLRFNRNIKIKT